MLSHNPTKMSLTSRAGDGERDVSHGGSHKNIVQVRRAKKMLAQGRAAESLPH